MDFPENVVSEIKTALLAMQDPDTLDPLFPGGVYRRAIRPTDPHLSCGVFAADWIPLEWQIGQYDPALTRYQVVIQTFVKHTSEEEGVVLHTRLAKRVRVMLYRDPTLRVQLQQLNTVEDGVTERMQRWGVSNQEYLSNQMDGSFIFLAVTNLQFETEIV